MTAQLYHENGVEITTHSMLKSFGRCPKAAQYKYYERLKKRIMNERDKPLHRGTWMHTLMQEYYAGRDWKAMHRKLSDKFGELFDEERDALGDLPRECAALMRSYLWHYGANKTDPFHGWTVKAVEQTLECSWPDGRGIYRGRVDLLVEDEYGFWIVDHKTHKNLPDLGIPVRGFIWNYIRTKVPSTPDIAYAGTPRERLSTASLDTDWPTYYLGIKALGRLNDPIAVAKMAQLKSQRWAPGEPQTSTFFRREILEKDSDMVARVVGSAMRTRDAMHGYHWDDPETVERTVDRSCGWCDFNKLCTTELFGGNAAAIRKDYRVGNPMDYYQDTKETVSN
jgi:hypothetical protein